MPRTCIRALAASQLSEQRPVHSMSPTQTLNPVVPLTVPYVDEKEFPRLAPSPNLGMGSIPGSKDFLQGIFEGFKAFKKPDASTVVPRSIKAKTAASTTTMTAVPTTSTVVTTAVPTTSTTTSSAPTSDLLNGRETQELKVSVSRLSPKQLQDACAKLAVKAKLNPTGQGKAKEKGSLSLKRLPHHLIRPGTVAGQPKGHPVPGPHLLFGTWMGRLLEAKVSQLGLLPKPLSPRRGLAKSTPLSWVPLYSRLEEPQPRGRIPGPSPNVLPKRSTWSITARGLVHPLPSKSTSRPALTLREPRPNLNRHGSQTLTCRRLPYTVICRQ